MRGEPQWKTADADNTQVHTGRTGTQYPIRQEIRVKHFL